MSEETPHVTGDDSEGTMYCHPVWARAVIDKLLSTSSPLLAQPTSSEDSKSLVPDHHNEEQWVAYNNFCRAVVDNCLEPITRLSSNDPKNPRRSRDTGSSKTGLSPMNRLAESEAQQRYILLAEAFLQTCPTEWDTVWGVNTKGTIRAFLRGEDPEEQDPETPEELPTDPKAMLRFYYDAAQLADDIVAFFKLPMPNGQSCLMWDKSTSLEDQATQPRVRHEDSINIIGFISRLEPQPVPGLQGLPFHRFSEYLTAAVGLARLSPPDQEKLLSKISDFIEEEKRASVKPTVEMPARTES